MLPMLCNLMWNNAYSSALSGQLGWVRIQSSSHEAIQETIAQENLAISVSVWTWTATDSTASGNCSQ